MSRLKRSRAYISFDKGVACDDLSKQSQTGLDTKQSFFVFSNRIPSPTQQCKRSSLLTEVKTVGSPTIQNGILEHSEKVEHSIDEPEITFCETHKHEEEGNVFDFAF
ncbi:hypothetical protein EIN_404990 [Entamoeba invadens IP1]|uniref:Uncharacterized protein n=1 Tax=Entamoeba invadens IP1 TaxID=370355 RepID=A0A0A1U6Y5_ENTIV|nr:hypothetical protein EIN_404990 [Entamoeba invadens IP1]ELP90085.1 hypothetical protein EIN_404990 [Entamoeba invadens IP1]|eukprot:XP_004256856.1 hypothetical protein EIN_404990 [Entamoeba invadens IP1]